MAKINDTTTYPNTAPALTDHLPMTDVSNTANDANGETVTVTLQAVMDLFEANFAAPASAIVSGTFADARIAESNVTQHEAALSITESQISDLGSYLPLGGGVMTGNIDLNAAGNLILDLDGDTNIGSPSDDRVDITLAAASYASFRVAGFFSTVPMFIFESTAALADAAGYGQFWVKDDTPNTARFTDDAGTDFQLATLTGTETLTNKTLTSPVISDIVSVSNGDINITPNGTGNVTLGTLAFNADQTVGAGQDNYVLTYDDATGLINLEASAGGGGTPGGSDTQIQFNDSGSFGGSANLTWDDRTLTIVNSLTGTEALSALSITPTWNTTGAPSAIKLNVTDIASNAASLLMDLQVGGTSVLSFNKSGTITGTIGSNSGTIYTTSIDNGIGFGTSSQLRVWIGGTNTAGTHGIKVAGAGYIGFDDGGISSVPDAHGPDVALHRDASAVLALRNGTTAQAFRIYNTYTDASNYERAGLRWNSNVFEIGTFAAGTGTVRELHLVPQTSTTGGKIEVAAVDVRPVRLYSANGGTYLEAASVYGSNGSNPQFRISRDYYGLVWGPRSTASATVGLALQNNTDTFVSVTNGNSKTTGGGIAFPTVGELTIATGAITVTGTFHRVDTEADAASDDLDTINGGIDGAVIILRAADSTRTVVVKDGTGNIQCAGDFSMDNAQDTITLIYSGALTAWLEISRSDNGA